MGYSYLIDFNLSTNFQNIITLLYQTILTFSIFVYFSFLFIVITISYINIVTTVKTFTLLFF